MRNYFAFPFAALFLISNASVAFALSARGVGRMPTGQVAHIVEKQPIVPPFAQILFCVQNPAECQDNAGPSEIELNADRMRELNQINKSVNRSIRGVNDRSDQMAGDVWKVNVRSGDCEDFALTKRSMLMARGWSSRALRIATGQTRSGEGHAVLVVKTDHGDLVMDNRFGTIKTVERTDLLWETIQSEADPLIWHKL